MTYSKIMTNINKKHKKSLPVNVFIAKKFLTHFQFEENPKEEINTLAIKRIRDRFVENSFNS